MVRSAPTLGRVLAMVAFALSCFGLLLFLWLAFGGPIPLQSKGYRFHVRFPNATQLAQQADVRISGVPVGKVVKLAPDARRGLTDATIQLDSRYAPIPRDTRAMLRAKTLLGETYVELTPGTRGPGRGLPEGGTLAQAQVAPTVALDDILRALDPATRRALQQWLQSQALALSGRGRDLNAALGNLAPFAADSDDLLGVLNAQHRALRGLVRNTGVVLDALTARDAELRSLVRNSNTVFSTTARLQAQLAASVRVLPVFEQEARLTLAQLAGFALDANPLVTQLRPAARRLSPTLRDLQALAPDLDALFADLDPLITASRTGLPALRAVLDSARPVLGQLDPALRQVNPILRYLGPYKHELTAFLANPVASTQAVTYPPGAKGQPVHYLRTTNPVSPEALAALGRRIGSNRPNPYVLPGGFKQLATGLAVFENRQCGRPVPRPVPSTNPLVAGITTFFYTTAAGAVPAPRCRLQGRFPGQTTDYPHVTADPPRR